jgi:hypothetical protein
VRADGFGPAFELFVPRFGVVSVERFLGGGLALTKTIVEQYGVHSGAKASPGEVRTPRSDCLCTTDPARLTQ